MKGLAKVRWWMSGGGVGLSSASTRAVSRSGGRELGQGQDTDCSALHFRPDTYSGASSSQSHFDC